MRTLLAVSVLALGAAGCQSIPADAPKANASLQPTKGSTVRGSANFVQLNGKVRVTANVTGLRPNGQFGFHIHEAGDCSSGDGMSAELDVITIAPGATSIVGRGLIVHVQPDDYTSQPAGNAGARGACAVIQRS